MIDIEDWSKNDTTEVNKWLPIETAPRTGERIRVVFRGLEYVARWIEDEQAFSYAGHASGYYYLLDAPKYWMPCNPPKE